MYYIDLWTAYKYPQAFEKSLHCWKFLLYATLISVCTQDIMKIKIVLFFCQV